MEEDLAKLSEEKEVLQAKLEEAYADRDALQAKVSYLQLQVEEKTTNNGSATAMAGERKMSHSVVTK